MYTLKADLFLIFTPNLSANHNLYVANIAEYFPFVVREFAKTEIERHAHKLTKKGNIQVTLKRPSNQWRSEAGNFGSAS